MIMIAKLINKFKLINPKTRNDNGFTLIEFVIVSLIIAIITAGLVRSFLDTSTHALEIAVKKVVNDLSFVRMRAVNTSKPHKVYINTPDRFRAGFGNYTLIKNPDDQNSFDIKISKKYPSVNFFSNYSVKFDALGRNVYSSVTSIVVTNGSQTKKIRIVSDTGNIYVQ